MKRDKKITQLAKKLVELSKDAQGVVTEAGVGAVLASLKQAEMRNYLPVLKSYMSYLRREVALQTAVVSTPGSLSAQALQEISAKYTAIYGRSVTAEVKVDPSLIAGVRVRVGDDVYDASVSGRLQRLAESVN